MPGDVWLELAALRRPEELFDSSGALATLCTEVCKLTQTARNPFLSYAKATVTRQKEYAREHLNGARFIVSAMTCFLT